MKDWWIVIIITIAVIYVSAVISSSENSIAVELAKLGGKIGETNEKIDALAEKIENMEDEVSGKSQKWRDKIDDMFGHP